MFNHHKTITIFVTLTNMNCIITILVIIIIFIMCKVQIEALIPLLGNGYATEMQQKHVPYRGEISKNFTCITLHHIKNSYAQDPIYN